MAIGDHHAGLYHAFWCFYVVRSSVCVCMCVCVRSSVPPSAMLFHPTFVFGASSDNDELICLRVVLQVSLDAQVRETINRKMVNPSSHTFDEAQIQIYTLMQRDSYPRFLNSQIYKRLLGNSQRSQPPPSPLPLEPETQQRDPQQQDSGSS